MRKRDYIHQRWSYTQQKILPDSSPFLQSSISFLESPSKAASCICFSDSNIFRTTRLWKLFLYKQRLTVTLETTCNGNDLMSLANLKSLWVSLSSSFFFLPLCGRFSMSPRSRYLFTTAYTNVLFSWRFLPISEYDYPASSFRIMIVFTSDDKSFDFPIAFAYALFHLRDDA